MRKLSRFLAEYLAPLVFLCCHYTFDLYITWLTLSFITVYVYLYSHQFYLCLKSWTEIISVAFKSILSQSRCFLEPKDFLRALLPLKILLRSQNTLVWTPSFVDARYAQFSADYIHSLDHVCLIFAHRAPGWRKPATCKHFFNKTNLFKNEWRNSSHY